MLGPGGGNLGWSWSTPKFELDGDDSIELMAHPSLGTARGLDPHHRPALFVGIELVEPGAARGAGDGHRVGPGAV